MSIPTKDFVQVKTPVGTISLVFDQNDVLTIDEYVKKVFIKRSKKMRLWRLLWRGF